MYDALNLPYQDKDMSQFFEPQASCVQGSGLDSIILGIVMRERVANFPQLLPSSHARQNTHLFQLV